MALVVFDLDGTISRHDSLLAYLAGFLRRNWGRWPRVILSAPALLGFAVGFVDRGQLKAALMKAVLGGCTRKRIDAWTAGYVTDLLQCGVFADVLTAIAKHRSHADTLVLMANTAQARQVRHSQCQDHSRTQRRAPTGD